MPPISAALDQRPIAVVPIGPSAQSLLAPLRANLPSGVQVLGSSEGLWQQLFQQFGLLVLLIDPASAEDGRAALALSQQVADTGFGVHTLCVVAVPKSEQDLNAQCLPSTHYALQALQTHVDAVMPLPESSTDTVAQSFAAFLKEMASMAFGDAGLAVDMQDLTLLLRDAGVAAWACAQASRPEQLLAALWAHPGLAGVDSKLARGVLVSMSGARGALKFSQVRAAMREILQRLHPDVTFLLATSYDEQLGDALRVSVLFTGTMAAAPIPTPSAL